MDLSIPAPALRRQPPSLLAGLRFARESRDDPLPQLQRLQSLGSPLVLTRVLHHRIVDVFDPALAHELLVRQAVRTHRWPAFTAALSRFHGPGSVLAAEGTAWAAARQALAPMYSPRALAPMAGDIAALAHAALHRAVAIADAEAGVDVDRLFTRIALQVVERQLFGSTLWSEAQLDGLSADTRRLAASLQRECYASGRLLRHLPGPSRRARLASMRRLDEALRGRQTAAPALAALGPDTRHHNIRTLFAAGHDTTATTLAWWCALMAHHPAEQHLVQAEIDAVLGRRLPTAADLERLPRLNAGLQEALRLYPVVPVLPARVLDEAIVLGGSALPRGAVVRIAPWALHRDPQAWPDPQAFRPQRFLPGAAAPARGAWLPFGNGPRACLGRPLAMLELGLVAAVLLQHFSPRPQAGAPLPEARIDVLLRPRDPLAVQMVPRPSREGRAVSTQEVTR